MWKKLIVPMQDIQEGGRITTKLRGQMNLILNLARIDAFNEKGE